MTGTIHKQQIEVTDVQDLEMPKGAKILAIQVQGRHLCVWYSFDKAQKEMEKRTIRIHGTGHSIEQAQNLHYIGTFQLQDGALVFHAFEQLSDVEALTRALFGRIG